MAAVACSVVMSCCSTPRVLLDEFQKLLRKVGYQDDALEIGWAQEFLHEQAIAVEPARKRAAEKIAPFPKDVHRHAGGGREETKLENLVTRA